MWRAYFALLKDLRCLETRGQFCDPPFYDICGTYSTKPLRYRIATDHINSPSPYATRNGRPIYILRYLPIENRWEELGNQALIVRFDRLDVYRSMAFAVQVVRVKSSNSGEGRLILLIGKMGVSPFTMPSDTNCQGE